MSSLADGAGGADQAEQECAVDSLDSLPDELLHAVLAHVPTEALLPLRLVNRRWSELVLSKPVWRQRVIEGCPHSSPPVRNLAAILRLAPVLRKLTQHCESLDCLRLVAAGDCQFRSLSLMFVAKFRANKVLQRIFAGRQSLEELEIHIEPANFKSPVEPVYHAIDALPRLRSLILHDYHLDFEFHQVCLSELRLNSGGSSYVQVLSSLLRNGKDTLRKVSLGFYPSYAGVKEELQACSKLTDLTVKACAGLAELLPLLPQLEWIRFTVSSLNKNEALAFFNSAKNQHFSVKIYVSFDVIFECHIQSIVDFFSSCNVHGVTLAPCYETLSKSFTKQLLQSLHVVEELVLETHVDLTVLEAWLTSAAPKLRKLSIRVNKQLFKINQPALAQKLKMLRPCVTLRFI